MTDTAFEARQHRIERRRRDKRARFEDDEDEDYDDTGADGQTSSRKIPLSAIKGIKKQARYEPVVPMGKEELSEWRKEARRVRNRESAAASRRKTRERIEELEGQVSELENKYASALARIAELEGQEEPSEITSFTSAIENQEPSSHRVSPTLSPAPLTKKIVLPNWSLGSQEAALSLANSLDVPQATSAFADHHQNHHQPLMFSRPTAA